MKLELFMHSFFVSLCATIIGGIILTFLIFFIKEKILPYPDISGRWFFVTTVKNTSNPPFEDMQLEYMAMIFREGNKIYGTSEKIHEISSTGERPYNGKNRTRGHITGNIEKRYLGKDKLTLHTEEHEFSRTSTNFYELLIKDKQEMIGSFNSMIADQSGEVIWMRTRLLKPA